MQELCQLGAWPSLGPIGPCGENPTASAQLAVVILPRGHPPHSNPARTSDRLGISSFLMGVYTIVCNNPISTLLTVEGVKGVEGVDTP